MSAFALYLVWRFLAPDALARKMGLYVSIKELGFKILQRMNLTDKSPITGFTEVFVGEMHSL